MVPRVHVFTGGRWERSSRGRRHVELQRLGQVVGVREVEVFGQVDELKEPEVALLGDLVLGGVQSTVDSAHHLSSCMQY